MALRLIVGCGYLGARVARRWLDAGDEVHVLARTSDRAEERRKAGYVAHIADVLDPASLADLPAADTVLVAYGFDRGAGRSILEVYADGLSHLLAALPSSVGRLIYVSSTGVYGAQTGATVDESSPCHPLREGGRACLEAEQRLLAHPLGERSIRLRLAGIYGPGRVPFLEALRSGRPVPTPADSWLNLIHVDDAATITTLVAERAPAPSLYVVSDGAPVRRRDFYQEIARRIGGPPPEFVSPDPDSAQAQRAAGGGDKRVDASRLFRELNPVLAFPTYREGLSDCLGAPPADGC